MKDTIIILIVVLLFSCKKENKKFEKSDKLITISGNIKNLQDSTLVVLKRKNSKKIDTAYVSQNSFSFEVKKDTLAFNISSLAFLTKNKSSFYFGKQKINPILFWDENTNIEFEGDIKKPNTISVISTHNIYNEFWKIPYSYNSKIENLFKSKKSKERKREILQLYMDSIKKKQVELIFKNPNNSYSLYCMIFFRSNFFSLKDLHFLYNKLSDSLKESKRGQLLKGYVFIERIKIGEHFKDFAARDLEGNTVKLSDFKGKIIVLDFWANWCKWCHIQNKEEFTPLYKKYKKEIVIISYALDENVPEWEASSKKDFITWVNLSNLKGTKDSVSYQYGATALPHTFLIDKKGIIIKQYTGYSGKNIIEEDIKKLLSK